MFVMLDQVAFKPRVVVSGIAATVKPNHELFARAIRRLSSYWASTVSSRFCSSVTTGASLRSLIACSSSRR
jgi:hypothetical protein